MAGKVHKVVALDEGYLVVNAPLSEFPEKGYFTMYDQSAVPKGYKTHSFHKYIERKPYTKENFSVEPVFCPGPDGRCGGEIKGDGNASWTAFVAPQGKDGSVLPERSYMPPSTGLTSFGKKGPEEELLAGLTIEAGLNIPTVPEGQEPNLRSRMYRNKYPDVEETVVVLVKRIDVMGVYVSLLEYDETEGMILLSELSRRRIRSVKKLINVGRQEVALVLRVDKDKGYIDLSKRRVSPEDVDVLEERFNKSKSVHSMMRNLATTERRNVEDLYESFAWDLAEEFPHILDAFKRMLVDPSILDKYMLPQDIKAALLKNVELRLTPQPVKIRSDFEVTCYAYEGIDAIKAALTAGIKCGTELNPISVRLIAPPLYVMTTNTLEQDFGIKLLEGALEKVKAEISARKGEILIKMAPTAVGAEEEAALAAAIEAAQRANMEVEGDSDEDEGDD